MKTKQQRAAINQLLQTKGLATLDDPRALLDQVGFLIRDHAAFRSLLLRLEPRERKQCYDSLKSRLRFTAKPLGEYETEGAQIAEREQMPRWDPDNENLSARVAAYEPPSIGEALEPTDSLAATAENAIRRAESGAGLELACGRCGATAVFHGRDRIFKVARALSLDAGDRFDAIKQARDAGWVYQMKLTKVDGRTKTDYREICPACAKA